MSNPEFKDGDGPVFEASRPEIKQLEEELYQCLIGFQREWEGLPSKPLDRAEYESLHACLDAWMPEVYSCYDSYTKALVATNPAPVICRAGCGGCCAHFVTSVEPFESLYLHGLIRKRSDYGSLVYRMHQCVSAYGSSLKESETPDEDEALFRYFLKEISCPFLNKAGSCGVYSHRPVTCRMFLSFSRPELCRGNGVLSPENLNFIVELPDHIEVVLAQIGLKLESLGIPVHLFSALLRINELFGQYEGQESCLAPVTKAA